MNNIIPLVDNKTNYKTSFSLEKFPLIININLALCAIWGIYRFGLDAFIIILSSVTLSIVLDLFIYLKNKSINKKYFINQSIMNGLIVSLIQTSNTPFFIPLITILIAFIIKISIRIEIPWINPILIAILFSYVAFENNYLAQKIDATSTPSVLVTKKQKNNNIINRIF